MVSTDALMPSTTMHALPRDTSSILSSAQLLTSPTAVAKELTDNALDAHATSLTLDISANTIDLIQLRDNGHGIPPADRLLTARRHCTSKIRSLADVVCLGGASLGFRGEALAGVAECAGTLSIVTRVAGEAVGASMDFGSNGELKGQPGRKSHPVGTTVTAKAFFDRWPVRKQAALKHADRVVAQIKKLMMAYAVARPAVRFQLNVVKGNAKAGAAAGKGDWVYVPSLGKHSMQDACLAVFGVGCTSQCASVVHEEDGFVVEGVIPRVDADADARKISGIGQFVSVDARPVATSKGTLKKVVELYKERLKKTGRAFEGIKDPFLCVDIKCPPGAYDPNVEPAKDDVMFVEQNLVLQAVENLLAKALPDQTQDSIGEQLAQAAAMIEEDLVRNVPLPDIPGLRRPQIKASESPGNQQPPRKDFTLPIRRDENYKNSKSVLADQDHDIYEIRLLSGRQHSTSVHAANPSIGDDVSVADTEFGAREQFPGSSRAPEQDEASDRAPKRSRAWKSNMYDFDVEDILQENSGTPHPTEAEEDTDDTEMLDSGLALSNPWTMAKMNTSSGTRKSPITFPSQQPTPLAESSSVQLNISASSSSLSSPLRRQQLPGPQTSSSPIRTSNTRDDFEMNQSIRRLQRSSEETHEPRSVPISPQSPAQPCDQNLGFQPVNSFVPINRPNSGPNLPQRTDPLAGQGQSGPRRQPPAGRVNKPFKSPMITRNPQTSTTANPRRSGRRSDPQSFGPEWQGRTGRHDSADGSDPIFDVPERDPNCDIRDFMASRIGQRQRPAFTPPAIDPDYNVDQVPQIARQTRNSFATALSPNSAATGHQKQQGPSNQGQGRRKETDTSQEPSGHSSEQKRQHRAKSLARAPLHDIRQLRPRPASSVNHDATLQDRDTTSPRPATRRRTRTRTKSRSAHLPLERIPSISRTQNLSLVVCTRVAAIADDLRQLDRMEEADGAYDCFAFEELWCVHPNTVTALAGRLMVCVQRAIAEEGCAVAGKDVFEEAVAAALARELKKCEGVSRDPSVEQ